MSKSTGKPLVGILMGSKNDWETMQAAGKILDEFGVAVRSESGVGPSLAGAGGRVHENRRRARAWK